MCVGDAAFLSNYFVDTGVLALESQQKESNVHFFSSYLVDHLTYLQCFDAVCWAAGRAFGLQKLSGEVLVCYLSGASCK